jgi:hypothetical protein
MQALNTVDQTSLSIGLTPDTSPTRVKRYKYTSTYKPQPQTQNSRLSHHLATNIRHRPELPQSCDARETPVPTYFSKHAKNQLFCYKTNPQEECSSRSVLSFHGYSSRKWTRRHAPRSAGSPPPIPSSTPRRDAPRMTHFPAGQKEEAAAG